MAKFIIYINQNKTREITTWLKTGEIKFLINDISLVVERKPWGYVPLIVSEEDYFRLVDLLDQDCGCPKPPVINREELTKDYLAAIGADAEKTYDIDNQTVSFGLDIAARIIEEKYRVENR